MSATPEDVAERFHKWNKRMLDLFHVGYGDKYTDQVADDVIEALDEYAKAAHANGKREGLEKAAEVFADFKTTPTDTEGRMWTTQEEVNRTAAKFLALAEVGQ